MMTEVDIDEILLVDAEAMALLREALARLDAGQPVEAARLVEQAADMMQRVADAMNERRRKKDDSED